MSDRARSFGAEATRYARARPPYAEESVRFVLPRVPCRVADVGAGTGKLTHVLLQLGCDVVAIEPDDAMRAQIEGVTAVAGAAEELPLARESVDAVVSGQAYHWFDRERFLPEAARVLRPGGTLGILWNWLDDSVPWVAALADASWSERASSNLELGPPFEPGLFLEIERLVVPHTVPRTAETLVDLVASYSLTIVASEQERAELLAAVREAAPAGEFDLPYVTCAWRAVRAS